MGSVSRTDYGLKLWAQPYDSGRRRSQPRKSVRLLSLLYLGEEEIVMSWARCTPRYGRHVRSRLWLFFEVSGVFSIHQKHP